MKRFILVGLLLTTSLNSCLFNTDPSFDYPPSDRSILTGPRLETLPEQVVSVQRTTPLPFAGYAKQFSNRYMLEGVDVSTKQSRRAVIENETVTELPARQFTDTFLDTQGNAWGLAIALSAADTLYRFQNNQWSLYSLLSTEKYYGYVLDASTDQFMIDTNEGVVAWDVSTKKRQRLLPKEKARVFTDTYMVGFADHSVLIQDRNTEQLLHAVQAGYTLWNAYEDKQNRLWFVVRDKNWDGLLYRYDGKTSQLLATVPVGYFDSGRSVGQSIVDKAGNFWLNVDGHYTVFTPAGKWIKPILPAPQDKNNLARVFIDDQQNVIATDSKHLFTISL